MVEGETDSPPLLKEIFNRERLAHFARETRAVYEGFDETRFIELASDNLADLSIMQRLRQIAQSFHVVLPGGYLENLEILKALAPRINHGFASITLPEYVALHGLQHPEISLDALRFFTRFGSSEFAVRPFLQQDMAGTLAVMQRWATDENEHVRRLASEGCRPRLPWSFQLKDLIANPDPVWPILDTLRADPSLYVRKSVANHLNDITKDHPDWVLDKMAAWPSGNPQTLWIIRQALRTLVKKGNPRALAQLGAGQAAEIDIVRFTATPEKVRLGSAVEIAADIVSSSTQEQRLVVDYVVHYVKKSGGTSAKVFKWKELTLKPDAPMSLSIRRAMRDFTTRTHYAGTHRVDLMVNGAVLAKAQFELVF